MTLKKIFVLTQTIEANESPEIIIKQLESGIRSRACSRFTNHTFKFILTGVIGIHRFYDMCYVSGVVQEVDNRCTVHYSIYPGIIFWISTLINFMLFMGNFISVVMLEDSICDFFLELLIINVILLVVSTLETRYQEKSCSGKIERIVLQKFKL